VTRARDAVSERVRSLLTDALALPIDGDALSDCTPLRGHGLGLDSVDLVALIVELEQAFDVSFEDDELAGALGSFGALVAAVHAKLAETPSCPGRAGGTA
jgi:acyl carrier protein